MSDVKVVDPQEVVYKACEEGDLYKAADTLFDAFYQFSEKKDWGSLHHLLYSLDLDRVSHYVAHTALALSQMVKPPTGTPEETKNFGDRVVGCMVKSGEVSEEEARKMVKGLLRAEG